MAHTVFVYGTLRRGGVREIPRLFPNARFVGFGTARGWLYDFGAYPGFIADAGGADVIGEVFEVDAAAVRAMDEIERYIEGDDDECYYCSPPAHHRVVRRRHGASRVIRGESPLLRLHHACAHQRLDRPR